MLFAKAENSSVRRSDAPRSGLVRQPRRASITFVVHAADATSRMRSGLEQYDVVHRALSGFSPRADRRLRAHDNTCHVWIYVFGKQKNMLPNICRMRSIVRASS